MRVKSTFYKPDLFSFLVFRFDVQGNLVHRFDYQDVRAFFKAIQRPSLDCPDCRVGAFPSVDAMARHNVLTHHGGAYVEVE